jgi:outer membrane protein assembly factor BamD (BamD/ComL family)
MPRSTFLHSSTIHGEPLPRPPDWNSRRILTPLSLAALAVLLALLAVLTSNSPLRADDKEQTYNERLEYDATTGQWLEIAPPIPGTEEGDLALARYLLAKAEYKEARQAFKEWFKNYPESASRAEGLFYAAETEIMAVDVKPKGGDIMKAYRWLEELLEGWPGTELADRAIRKEIIIAEMLLFKHRQQKIWGGVLWLSGEEEALKILDRIIDDWARETPVGEQALRLKADYFYENGEFEEAEQAYARLTRDFARGRYYKLAMLRSGESAFARFPGVEYDGSALVEASVYFTDFQSRYPREAGEYAIAEKLGRIRESQAQKDYLVGRYYERTKATGAAVYYYRLVERTWPGSTWAAEARGRLIELGAAEPVATQEQ